MSGARVAILTISDSVSRGERDDTSGEAIEAWAGQRGDAVVARVTTPDDAERIREWLASTADAGEADVVITTGGTGFTARDVTPEATSAVLERPAPGIAEAVRARGADSTPTSWLSRGVAGILRGERTDRHPHSG
jgi:molybdopterin adenylyltransferase